MNLIYLLSHHVWYWLPYSCLWKGLKRRRGMAEGKKTFMNKTRGETEKKIPNQRLNRLSLWSPSLIVATKAERVSLCARKMKETWRKNYKRFETNAYVKDGGHFSVGTKNNKGAEGKDWKRWKDRRKKKCNKTEVDGYTYAIVAYGTCNLRGQQSTASACRRTPRLPDSYCKELCTGIRSENCGLTESIVVQLLLGLGKKERIGAKQSKTGRQWLY